MKLARTGQLGAEKPALVDADGILRSLEDKIPDIDGAALSPEALDRLRIFTQSSSEHHTPNIESHVQTLSLDRFGEPLHRFPALTVSVCNLRPQSRGSCHIGSADPAAPPVIRPNYLADAADVQVAVASIRQARAQLATRTMQPYAPAEMLPGPDLTSDAKLRRATGDISTTIFHPVSTARLGRDAGAVVLPDLTVHGMAGCPSLMPR